MLSKTTQFVRRIDILLLLKIFRGILLLLKITNWLCMVCHRLKYIIKEHVIFCFILVAFINTNGNVIFRTMYSLLMHSYIWSRGVKAANDYVTCMHAFMQSSNESIQNFTAIDLEKYLYGQIYNYNTRLKNCKHYHQTSTRCRVYYQIASIKLSISHHDQI